MIVLGYWNVVLDGRVAAKTNGADGVADSETATDVVNNALQAAAKQTGAAYISTDPTFYGPDGGEDPTGWLASDGDHPNAPGQATIAALILPIRS